MERQRGNIQNHELYVIFLDFFYNPVNSVVAHCPVTIGDQNDFPFVLQFLAVRDDHLHGQNDSGDS